MGKCHSIFIKSLKFLAGVIIGLVLSVLIIVGLDAILDSPNPFGLPNPNLWLIGAVISVCVLLSTWVVFKILAYKEIETEGMSKLPSAVFELIGNIICNMRYRRKVRAEVSQELADHFADALIDCKDEQKKQQLAREMIEGFGDAPLLGVLLRRAKKRCRPMWRTAVVRGFQAFGILILLLIIHCVYLLFARPVRSVNYVQKITQLNRSIVDESTNAAVLYKEAFELYKDKPTIEVQEPERTWIDDMNLLRAISDRKKFSKLSEEELSLIRKWVDDNEEALEKFKAGSRRANCWWERKSENAQSMLTVDLEELSPTYRLLYTLCWRARIYAADGKIEEAIDDLLCCYRVGGHFKGPRFPTHQALGRVFQNLSVSNTRIIIADNKIDIELLEEIQAEFEQFKAADDFIMDCQTLRFYSLDILQQCYTDNGRGGGRMIPGQVSKIQNPKSGGDFRERSTYLTLSLISPGREDIKRELEKVFDTIEKYAHKSPWQFRDENIDLIPEFYRWSKIKRLRYALIAILWPDWENLYELTYRSRSEIDALITITALLRYERKNSRYPESLDVLIEEGLLQEMPMDPYSDKPLVYKKTDEGFTLYSMGEDFKDDCGVQAKRLTPWIKEGDEVFWPLETHEQLMNRINARQKKSKQPQIDKNVPFMIMIPN